MSVASPADAIRTEAPRLPAFALYAALLAAAGLPIYIHAPKFFADEYGVSLAAMGVVLGALRFLDVVQDPALGWLSARLRAWRAVATLVATTILALSMIGLFAILPPVAPLLWFAICLTGLFSAFSFLTITFYAQGVDAAAALGEGGHVRVAGWRETGALLGVSIAAIAPGLAMAVGGAAPFAIFAWGFVVLAALATAAMRGNWQAGAAAASEVVSLGGFRVILRDELSRRLLIIALVNAIPVAVTSNLFLFFVESRLMAPGLEGPFLLLFFLSAAGAAPLWARAARKYGARRMLLWGMALSIVAFMFAATLGAGDLWAFALICIASGAALGADMTLLPALFATRLARIAPGAAQGFGLWNFMTKFTLAIAAVTLLPVLELSGFRSGTDNPESALWTLTVLYALIPCALKLVAIVLLARTRNVEEL